MSLEAGPISIRAARAGDLESLVAFNAAMARETEGLELDRARLTEGVREALADAGRGSYLIAERGDRPVGCLLVTREWSDWRAGWIWWIQSVFVARDERRSGVYSALHRHVVASARAERAVGLRLYVDADNRAAQSTYERLGMARSHYLLYEVADPLRK